MTRNIYVLGKCDYNDIGRKNCKATFEWELKDGIFSMSANIWNPRETDIICGGQNVEEVIRYFPDDNQARRMVEVWKKWHLNELNAGSPAQSEFLNKNPIVPYDYDKAKTVLKEAGLNPDPNYIHNGKPYEYGSAWIRRELPAEIISEINSWKISDEEEDPFTAWLDERYIMKCIYLGFEDQADRYLCNLQTKFKPGEKQQKMTVNWRQGTGHRKDGKGRPYNQKDAVNNPYQPSRQFNPKKSEPTIKAVMDSVINDAQVYLDCGDVANFIDEFGYNDFREARRIWQACEERYYELKSFAGVDFHELMDIEQELEGDKI